MCSMVCLTTYIVDILMLICVTLFDEQSAPESGEQTQLFFTEKPLKFMYWIKLSLL